jgi:hypothetical protein
MNKVMRVPDRVTSVSVSAMMSARRTITLEHGEHGERQDTAEHG